MNMYSSCGLEFVLFTLWVQVLTDTTQINDNIKNFEVNSVTSDVPDNFTGLENITVPEVTVPTVTDNTTIEEWGNTTMINNVSTTILPPIQSKSDIDAEVHSCQCDLKVLSCDINCCCDTDCTSEDESLFSSCYQTTSEIQDYRYCDVPSFEYIWKNNTVYTTRISVEGMLCIHANNVVEMTYYHPKKAIFTNGEFLKMSSQYEVISWNSIIPVLKPDQVFSSGENYRHGQYMWRVANNNMVNITFVHFETPSQMLTSACDINAPVMYLEDINRHCTRVIPTDKNKDLVCAGLGAVSYFDFCLLAKPNSWNEKSESNTTSTISPITSNITLNACTSQHRSLLQIRPCLCAARHCEECNIVDWKNYEVRKEGNTCVNVVSDVAYTFWHTVSDGVEDAQVQITLQTMSVNNFQQTFSVEFVKWGDETVLQRSGNPGYQIGRPLITATRVFNASSGEFVKQASNSVSIFTLTSDSICDFSGLKRQTVTFGFNQRVGCYLPQSSWTCNQLYNNVIQLLLGMPIDDLNTTFVASMGNYDVLQESDWLPILVNRVPTSSYKNQTNPTICQNLFLSLIIEVMYSSFGSVGDPQLKLVGLQYKLGSPLDIHYPCLGSHCPLIEVTTVVKYIDVSESPLTKYGVAPEIPAKLPSDFFYPFLCSEDEYSSGCWCLTVFFMIIPGLLWGCALTNFLLK